MHINTRNQSKKIHLLISLIFSFFLFSNFAFADSTVYLKNQSGLLVGKITYPSTFVNEYIKVNSFCVYKTVVDDVSCEYISEDSPLAGNPDSAIINIGNTNQQTNQQANTSGLWGAIQNVSSKLDGFIKTVTGSKPAPQKVSTLNQDVSLSPFQAIATSENTSSNNNGETSGDGGNTGNTNTGDTNSGGQVVANYYTTNNNGTNGDNTAGGGNNNANNSTNNAGGGGTGGGGGNPAPANIVYQVIERAVPGPQGPAGKDGVNGKDGANGGGGVSVSYIPTGGQYTGSTPGGTGSGSGIVNGGDGQINNLTAGTTTIVNLTALNSTITNLVISGSVSGAFNLNSTGTSTFATTTTASSSTKYLNADNAVINNSSSTNIYATNASLTNATTTNLFSVFANFLSGYIGTLFGNNSNFVVSYASTTNASTSNSVTGNITNLFSSTAVVTNETVGNLTSTTSTSLASTTAQGLLIAGSIIATTTLQVNGSTTLASTTASNLTVTGNLSGTNINGQNLNIANATITNSTSTNLFSSIANIGSAIIQSIFSPLAYITTLYATTTNATTSNAVTFNGTTYNGVTGNFTTLYASTANATTTNFVGANGTNATITNATLTNLNVSGAFTTASPASFTATASFATTTAASSTIVNLNSSFLFSSMLTALTGIFTNLFATNATLTNATATNLVANNLTLGTTNGWLYGANGVVNGSSSPTVGYITATSGTSTFLGINASGSIIPLLNDTYDLGDPTHRFKSLYVSSTTIYIDGTALSNNSGLLTWSGSGIQAITGTSSLGDTLLSTATVTNNLAVSSFTNLGGIVFATTSGKLAQSTALTYNQGSNTLILTGGLNAAATSSLYNLDMQSTKIVNVALPTNSTDAANKAYVDGFAQGVNYQAPVKSLATTSVAGAVVGDRFIIQTGGTGTTCSLNQIAELIAVATWSCFTPATGTTAFVDNGLDTVYNYNGSVWVSLGSTVNHSALIGLQGGQANEYYHLNSAQYVGLNNVNAQITNLQTTGNPTFNSITLTNGISVATSSLGNATSTNLYSTTASSTNLFATIANFGAATFNSLFSPLGFITTIYSTTTNAVTVNGTNGYFQNLYASTTNATTTNTSGLTTTGTLSVGGGAVTASTTGLTANTINATNLNISGVFSSALTNGFVFRGGTTNLSEATSSLFLANSGNIGIGTTTISTGYKFKVENASSDANIGVQSFGSASGAGSYVLNNNNAYLNTAVLGSSYAGNLFTGVPNANLAVISASNGVSGLAVQTGNSSPMYFGTNNIERMRIDANGNVGIGTTNPDVPLSVVGQIKSRTSDWVAGTTGSAIGLTPGATTGNTFLNIQGYNSGGAAAGNIAINAVGGNVGIGTTAPGFPLDVNGNVNFRGSDITTGDNITTGDARMELGGNRTGSGGNSYIDLHSQTGTDYESRIIRGGGVNGDLALINTGTGAISLGLNNNAQYITISSATSTYNTTGGINLTAGCFAINGTCLGSGGSSLIGTTGQVPYFSAANSAAGTSSLFISTAGYIGIGTTVPGRKLSVTDTVSAPQMIMSYDATRFTTLQVDTAGDFLLAPSGNNVRINDGNTFICSGGSCPSGSPSGNGNLIVESKIGVGSSTPWAAISVAGGAIVSSEFTLTDAATITVDMKNGNQQRVILGGNRTINFSNYIPGQLIRLVVCQDGTGSRTVTWDASVAWPAATAPTLTTTANKCDVASFFVTGGTGTIKIYGSTVANF